MFVSNTWLALFHIQPRCVLQQADPYLSVLFGFHVEIRLELNNYVCGSIPSPISKMHVNLLCQ